MPVPSGDVHVRLDLTDLDRAAAQAADFGTAQFVGAATL